MSRVIQLTHTVAAVRGSVWMLVRLDGVPDSDTPPDINISAFATRDGASRQLAWSGHSMPEGASDLKWLLALGSKPIAKWWPHRDKIDEVIRRVEKNLCYQSSEDWGWLEDL